MPLINLSTFIKAPVDIVFNLSRSIELHMASTAHTQERAVAGRTSGLCEAGDTITWEAIHFGIRQRLTVEITRMQLPYFFEDRMVRGAFKGFTHQHIFEPYEGGTLMKDIFEFHAPLGILGRLAEILFLKRYMTSFLEKRNRLIQQEAEKQHAI